MEKTENAKMKINTLLGILLVSVITSYIIHNHVQQRNTEMQLASALERTEALEKEINLVYQEIEKIRDSIDAQNSSLQANMRRSVRQELDSIMVDSARKNKEKVLSIFSNAYDVKNDHVYGNPNARFSIYEYLDFECPYCAQFSVTAKKVADDSNGHVNVILRALFAGKSTDGIVQNLNLNTEDIASCMSSENALTGLLQGLAEGEKLQVDSTPTVFILDTKQNKRLRVPGTPSEGDIANIIAGILR